MHRLFKEVNFYLQITYKSRHGNVLINSTHFKKNKVKSYKNKRKLFLNMNKDLSQMTIEKDITQADYPTLFKGIWTGVLISLIVHQFINH